MLGRLIGHDSLVGLVGLVGLASRVQVVAPLNEVDGKLLARVLALVCITDSGLIWIQISAFDTACLS